MADNRQLWLNLLRELEQRQQAAEAMGGPEKIAQQQARNRLTARQRLQRLFDPGSFREIGALAGGQHPGGDAPLAGDGVVGGTGRVHGRSTVALAEDFTVKGGSIGHVNAAKRTRLVRLALEQRLPLVIMLDGAGERAGNGRERYPNTPNDLQLVADLQGVVPVVCMVLGASAGHGALTGMFADFIVMVEGASLFTAGPPLVEAALGLRLTPEELGGGQMHSRESGVVHNLVANEKEAFDQVRRYLSLLAGQRQPADAAPSQEALLDLLPPAGARAYDMRAVLELLADEQSVFELQPAFGESIICALLRLGGHVVMVIANQPLVLAGAINRQAAEKASHFIGVADAFGLPLLSLVDNPGVLPGPQSEAQGVLKAAGRMFSAQRRFRGQKIVVTLRKAFGFGSSVMGMNPWDRQAISIALPSVSLGGIPAIGGARAAGASDEEQAQMLAREAGAWVPADAMAFDKVVDPRELRAEIIDVLGRSQAEERTF
ncbi:carboxyl transferase [Seongchinamella sediminis]|uniref:Carboxyl transferase n=1 Tax=Seongchinamella sediminis TaxID=2283635 RepID=A0A3L7DUW2_9GAMM|nr:carboxyl transferase domain-containing protein [Seongchinamella sediminis]RLQ20565.1 carboxyl transferase [Seongchinamella sediminis]